jgi:hypothetical protein
VVKNTLIEEGERRKHRKERRKLANCLQSCRKR